MASSTLPYLVIVLLQVALIGSTQTPLVYILRVDAFSKPSVFPTHYHWYTAEFTEPTKILHVYDTVFHGFSALLTADEAASSLQHSAVLAAFPDRRRQLHTTRSPQFIGLRNQEGLWSESDYGSDVIIGIFDTGIWPERRSFSDLNLGPVPDRWRGICQTGVEFTHENCNRKIIGARFFSKGHEAGSGFAGAIGGINDTIEFKSPRDADGHGTHTASTAAGRYSFNASLEGFASGIAKGVAPKSRLAVYKVCWRGAGCLDSDILAAFDAAVKDGVDVISISVGGGEGISSPYYLDPIAIGAYSAVSRGIFVSSSAGNDGPNGMSVTNLAPWLTTVGAGTIDRNFPAEVVLSDGRKFSGVSLYAGEPLNGKMYPLVYPGESGMLSASLCMENSLDPSSIKGRIAICDRGSNPRVAKGLVVKKAGGVGMILANGISNGEGLVGDAHMIPSCSVGYHVGDELKSYLASNPSATATINFGGTVIGIKPAPVVASFSARGPNALNPQILKPDLIAPGVNILAAWTDAVGPTGLDSDARRVEFNILSGTSMACPHVSGAAALLKSAHPDWSPAALRSAMMTTASLLDNSLSPVWDEANQKPASPYDFGAGNLNLELAMDPGLVYDLSEDDYSYFLCSVGYSPKTIEVITHSPVRCPARKPLSENFNYPSITVSLPHNATKKTFFRTVTNVGAEVNAVYRVRIEQPRGVIVSVKPRKLVFSGKAMKQAYIVSVNAESGNLSLGDSGALFGSISWMDGKHVVRSPLLITQTDPL